MVRTFVATALACLAAVLLVGCGGSGSSSAAPAPPATTDARTTPVQRAPVARSSYAKALGALCARRRSSLEAIGNPSSPKELTSLLPKQLVVLKRFSVQSKKLQAPAGEAKAKKDFDRFYATYLDGQIYALKTLRSHSYDGYFTVVNSALIWQKQAEVTAGKIGAGECLRRPFAKS
jgi:hypothetical protein